MSGNPDFRDHMFNLGNMSKKPAGTDPILGDFYQAGDVRPLVIVNTDNRLMANAVRLCMEPILVQWISSNQQGFLRGRSMLSNVIDVTHQAQLVSLKDAGGGMFLFDFMAAFPSLAHGYLHEVLHALGLPPHILNFIRSLYDQHCCHIVAGGEMHRGFEIKAGIRQGCPLSPLLFALVGDIILRRLQRLCPTATIRAFADDIALVSCDVHRDTSTLMAVFAEAAKVAGLSLNLPKCVLIPLWPVDYAFYRHDFARAFPSWAGMTIAGKGVYLGFVIGPEAGHDSWTKPLAKYIKAAQFWGGLGLGMQYSVVAYTTYVLPILSYVAQICAPSDEALAYENRAIRLLFRGPGHWCSNNDLWFAADHFGQARNLPSLSHMCMAAKKRVELWEKYASGGLGARAKYRQLQDTLSCTDHINRVARWSSWYYNGPIATLHKNSDILGGWGLHGATLLKAAGWEDIDPEDRARGVKKVKSKFQACARKAIVLRRRPDHLARIRAKIQRWRLPGPPRHTTDRCANMLRRLARLVPPRVASAVWKTLWNACTTGRWFQRQGHKCLRGCGSRWGEDSIEHYAH